MTHQTKGREDWKTRFRERFPYLFKEVPYPNASLSMVTCEKEVESFIQDELAAQKREILKMILQKMHEIDDDTAWEDDSGPLMIDYIDELVKEHEKNE